MIIRTLITLFIIVLLTGCKKTDHTSENSLKTEKPNEASLQDDQQVIDQELFELSNNDFLISRAILRQQESIELVEREISLRVRCQDLANKGLDRHFTLEKGRQHLELIRLLKGRPTAPELICGHSYAAIKSFDLIKANSKQIELRRAQFADLLSGAPNATIFKENPTAFTPIIEVDLTDIRLLRAEWAALKVNTTRYRERWMGV